MIQITPKSDEDHRNFYNRRVFMLQRFLSLFFTETIQKTDPALARRCGQLLAVTIINRKRW
jgi:hypothetical protein